MATFCGVVNLTEQTVYCSEDCWDISQQILATISIFKSISSEAPVSLTLKGPEAEADVFFKSLNRDVVVFCSSTKRKVQMRAFVETLASWLLSQIGAELCAEYKDNARLLLLFDTFLKNFTLDARFAPGRFEAGFLERCRKEFERLESLSSLGDARATILLCGEQTLASTANGGLARCMRLAERHLQDGACLVLPFWWFSEGSTIELGNLKPFNLYIVRAAPLAVCQLHPSAEAGRAVDINVLTHLREFMSGLRRFYSPDDDPRPAIPWRVECASRDGSCREFGSSTGLPCSATLASAVLEQSEDRSRTVCRAPTGWDAPSPQTLDLAVERGILPQWVSDEEGGGPSRPLVTSSIVGEAPVVDHRPDVWKTVVAASTESSRTVGVYNRPEGGSAEADVLRGLLREGSTEEWQQCREDIRDRGDLIRFSRL